MAANALCGYRSGSNGDCSASTDSPCLSFEHEWWWSYSARTCDPLLPKYPDLCVAACPELCGCRRALPGSAPPERPVTGSLQAPGAKKWMCPHEVFLPKIAVAPSASTQKHLTQIQFGICNSKSSNSKFYKQLP